MTSLFAVAALLASAALLVAVLRCGLPQRGLTRSAADQLPDLVYEADAATGRVRWCNAAVGRLLGLTPAELRRMERTRGRAPVAHPDDLPAVDAMRERLVAAPQGSIELCEFRVASKDGSWKWVRTREWVVARGRDGRPTRFLGVATDITEDRAALDALRERESRLGLVLDSVHDGTWDWHLPTGRVQLSATHERLLGYSRDELPTTIADWERLVHPDDGGDRAERVARLLSGETDQYEAEYRVRRRDGTWKWMLVRGSVVERDAAGRAIRAVGSHGDADRRKHAESAVQQALAVASVARAQAESLAESRARLVEELEAAHAGAVESARLKSEFLANMSHEIRTPMNAIIGFSDLLLEMNLDETERDFAQTVSTAAHSLLDVINDILDFSKIEAGRMQLDPRPFELRPLIEEVTEMLAPRAQAKGVDVAVDLPLGEPAWLEGDAVRVRQILVNLMGNAVKFTERGHVVLRIRSRHDDAGSRWWCFDVEDTGVGIAEEQQQRIFGKFLQADGAHTRRYGGTGLGLAISRELALLMGGDIRVQSTPGVGSTFSLEVPLPATEQAPSAPTGRWFGVKVLHLHDSLASGVVLGRRLRELGADVLELHAAAELPSVLATMRFDLLFADASLPGFDPAALLAEVKTAGAPLPRTRAIYVPASRLEVRAQAEAAGWHEVLRHPVRIGAMDALLREASERQAVPSAAAALAEAGASSRTGTRLLAVDPSPMLPGTLTDDLRTFGYDVTPVEDGDEAVRTTVIRGFDALVLDCRLAAADGVITARRIRRREQAAGSPRLPILGVVPHGAGAEEGRRCLEAGMDAWLEAPLRPEDVRLALEVFVQPAAA